MINKLKNNVFSSYTAFVKYFFGISVIVLLLFFFIGQLLFPSEKDKLFSNCEEYNPPWEQILEDGRRVSVTAPTIVDAEYGQPVTLATKLPDTIENGLCISFRPVWQDVTIHIDGELRLEYSTKDTRPFGTNSAMRYIFIELHEEDAGKELSYTFTSNSKYAGDIRTGYIGDRLSIWLHLLDDNGLHMLIAIFLFLMSLFCIIVCEILRLVYKKDLPLKYLAWTLFFCAFWMISEMSFRQIVFKNISLLSLFTYWSLMIIPLPLITFINDLQQGRYKKVFFIPLVYTMGIMIVGTILQVFDIVQFVEQLKFIHGGLLAAIICIIATITIDTFTKKLSNYLFVGIGIYGMIVTAILEMILYYVGTDLSLGTTLSVGLLFLLVMAIIKTGQDLLISENNKQQAITAREAQTKFLANMSHEIRTPINAIIGMNEMILRENDDEDIDYYARSIQSASNMLLGLINDILDFSKIEAGQLELIEDDYHLPTLIRDEMVILETRSSKKPIDAYLEIDPKLPTTLYGDELKLKQIITNIISNAAKYTDEGSITFKVFFKEIDEKNINLCFSITDTGIGIKKEDLSQLFDSFKRLDLNKNRAIQGSGLGLNIAKQFVDLMKGDIQIESEYGKGSTFTVSIPQKVMDSTPIESLDKAMKNESKVNQIAQAPFIAPTARILVVDDNSMNLRLMEALLKRTKVNVDLAESGSKCLELSKDRSYNIIFMDHMMPEMDGIEALQKLRGNESNPNRDTVVIALTANAVAGCREMYLEHGFNDYLSKPVIADKLETIILNYLPKELVIMNNIDDNTSTKDTATAESALSKEALEQYLVINKENGLKFCMEDENFYNEILTAFCSQANKFIPQLAQYYDSKDWGNYAIIAHSLKSNTRTIGADNFADLSYKHELAGKGDDGDFITSDYEKYVAALKALMEKVQEMV